MDQGLFLSRPEGPIRARERESKLPNRIVRRFALGGSVPPTMEGETERIPVREEEGGGGGGRGRERERERRERKREVGILLRGAASVPPGSHACASPERRGIFDARSQVLEGVVRHGGDRFPSRRDDEGRARHLQVATNIRRDAVDDGSAQVQRKWDVLESVHGNMRMAIARPAADVRRVIALGRAGREHLGMGHREGAEDYVL